MTNAQTARRSRAPRATNTRRSSDAAIGELDINRRRVTSRTAEGTTFGIHQKMENDLRLLEQAAVPARSTLPREDMLYGPRLVSRSYSPAPAYNLGSFSQVRVTWIIAAMALAVVVLLWHWSSTPAQTSLSMWNGGAMQTLEGSAPAQAALALPQLSTPPGQHSLVAAPSVTAAQIDKVLAQFGSPAAGTGELWVKLGEQYQIDPAYALAFFIHESSAGTNPNWAGLKPGGATTHNVGNIICAGYATCYGRFRDYPDWQAGIADWYRLIHDEYVQGRNLHTLEQIIPVYAPSVENNVPAYVQAVTNLINSWKQ